MFCCLICPCQRCPVAEASTTEKGEQDEVPTAAPNEAGQTPDDAKERYLGGNPTGLERRHEKKYDVNHNWLVVWNQQQIGVLMGFNTDLYITIINGIS